MDTDNAKFYFLAHNKSLYPKTLVGICIVSLE